jgi:dihydropteroate synthase
LNAVLHLHDLEFVWGSRTYVMGILNVTPDSFSGDGLISSVGTLDEGLLISKTLEQARQFAAAGCDILDVGGESTRPGAQPVGLEEEMKRVVPVVRALISDSPLPVSVDTYRAAVAEAALQAGACMVNDVWGLKGDPDIAGVAARAGVPVILMHNRSSWVQSEVRERLGGRYVGVPYENLLEDVKRELLESVEIAHRAGISDEKIILDPGIGFGKTVEQNLELIDRVDEIRLLGFPVLVGPSRKSFIGYTLDLPPEQREEGTAASVAVSILRGADIIRVHDVAYMQRVARMTDAIVRRRKIQP